MPAALQRITATRGSAVALVLALLTGVFVLGELAVHFAPPDSHTAAWWPAAGVAIIATAVTTPRFRPLTVLGVAIVSGLANYAAGTAADVSFGFALSNATEAFLVVWWLSRGRVHPRLMSLEDLWRLMVAALIGASIAGLLAGLALWLLQGESFLLIWRAVFASHVAATMVLVPLALRVGDHKGTASRTELIAQSATLVVVVSLVFGPNQPLPLAFLPMPVLMWGAVRLSPRLVTWQLVLTGTLTSTLTTAGYGPFAAAVQSNGLPPEMIGTILQANLVTLALVALPLSIAAAQRRSALTDAITTHGLFESVLGATSGTSIIGTDKEGVITFFNVGAENLLGYRADEVVGTATPSLIHDPGEVAETAEDLGIEPGFGVLVALVDAWEPSGRRDWTYIAKDGSRISVSLRISAMRDDRGVVTGYLSVAEDVTDRLRTETALRDALDREREGVERLAHLDQVKTDFVSSVSHELRTPITSVLGYTELLGSGTAGTVTERQLALLGRVERNAKRLLLLIEDLLILSRIESGTLRLATEPVSLCTVVAHSVEAIETQVGARHLELKRETSGCVQVLGDAEQLERVMINLLTNAVKFTPEGGHIRVTVRAVDGEAELAVSDTGIGIPPEDQTRLFERFFRSSASHRLAVPGTGLGLSIVEKIVTEHQGRVVVESSPGHGTTFRVRLPLLALQRHHAQSCESSSVMRSPSAVGLNGLTT